MEFSLASDMLLRGDVHYYGKNFVEGRKIYRIMTLRFDRWIDDEEVFCGEAIRFIES